MDNELEITAGHRMEPVSYPDTPVPIIWIGCSRRRRPTRSPERWIASARRECLDRMLITGERHLRLILSA